MRSILLLLMLLKTRLETTDDITFFMCNHAQNMCASGGITMEEYRALMGHISSNVPAEVKENIQLRNTCSNPSWYIYHDKTSRLEWLQTQIDNLNFKV